MRAALVVERVPAAAPGRGLHGADVQQPLQQLGRGACRRRNELVEHRAVKAPRHRGGTQATLL